MTDVGHAVPTRQSPLLAGGTCHDHRIAVGPPPTENGPNHTTRSIAMDEDEYRGRHRDDSEAGQQRAALRDLALETPPRPVNHLHVGKHRREDES